MKDKLKKLADERPPVTGKETQMDYLKLYNLETYLFDTVSSAFQKNGRLNAFDFFCIVIWKANRAKSKVALKMLLKDVKGRKDLDAIAKDLTSQIHDAKSREERMKVLIRDGGFRLPMASAILTVLYPNDFTIYDVRVCNVLGNYHKVQTKKPFDDLWRGYEEFLDAVKKAAPEGLSLRDKDRYLWGKSFANDLVEDIETLFQKDEEEADPPVRIPAVS